MNVKQAFKCLLTDVSTLSGVPMHAPDDVDMTWIRETAPMLDKMVLSCLENGGDLLEIAWPEWLHPLVGVCQTARQQDCRLAARYLGLLHQVLVFGYKTEEQPTNEQLKAASAAFVEVDQSLDIHSQCFIHWRGRVGLMEDTRKLCSRVLANVDFSNLGEYVMHGPGAVFPPYDHCDRSKFDTVVPSIEAYYPFFFNFVPCWTHLVEFKEYSIRLKEGGPLAAKLTPVPKDSRGPRLICVHSREAIWIQQGLRKKLEEAISRHPLTFRKIIFDDQTQQGRLALQGSSDGSYATIDLKDASDRLSADVVSYLLGSQYVWFDACRAREVVLPDGSSHSLRKYGPMGNATVFPLQSLIFWAIATAGISVYAGRQARRDVYVFGDDIIVPTEHFGSVIKALTRFGLVPNPNKCFHKGLFRESCGVDAYAGVDITPIRLKKYRGVDYNVLEALCNVAMRLRGKGFEETAAYVYSHVRRVSKGPLPLSNNPHSAGLFEWVDRDHWYCIRNTPRKRGCEHMEYNDYVDYLRACGYENNGFYRWNHKLHRYEVYTLQQRSLIKIVDRCDWNHVLDWFVGSNRQPSSITSSESRGKQQTGYPDPHRYRYKRGWTPLLERPDANPSFPKCREE